MSHESTTVGEALRSLRLKSNLGIKKAAPQIEISPSYLSKVENNHKRPSPGLIRKLCNLYGATSSVEEIIAIAGVIPEDIQNIVRTHGKEVFELIRSEFTSDTNED